MSRKEPRLRTAEKVPPPYPLGVFPKEFPLNVGKQIIYIMATKPTITVQGSEWEQIFANSIGAEWKPSNVGLDDIVMGNCAWGAKTLYAGNPWNCKSVRLISGRNSPVYSYGDTISTDSPPNELGEKVLDIWNARVDSVRSKFKHVRTVVLIKKKGLEKVSIFETETIRYNPKGYQWKWNKRGNLEGYDGEDHVFTWQPHGSQFTIIEKVPDSRVKLKLKAPRKVTPADVLDTVGFDDSWIKVV